MKIFHLSNRCNSNWEWKNSIKKSCKLRWCSKLSTTVNIQTKLWCQINLATFRIAYLLTNNFRILSSLFNSKVISLNKLFNNNKINRYLIKWIWINTIWTIWMVSTLHKTSNQTITFKISTHSYSNTWVARVWSA